MGIIYSHFVPPTNFINIEMWHNLRHIVIKGVYSRNLLCVNKTLIKVLINAKYFHIIKISEAEM